MIGTLGKMRHLLHALVGIALAAPAAAQTLGEVVALNLKARGGIEKIKAVRTVRMTGSLEAGPEVQAAFALELKRPRSMRAEFRFRDVTVLTLFDGAAGWRKIGEREAEPMSLEESRQVEEQADLDGPLVDWKAKGHSVELLGKDKIDGGDVWKLRMVLKDGSERALFLDARSGLEIRSESKRNIRGQEVLFESRFSDYRGSGGLQVPFQVESGPVSGAQRQKMIFDTIEFDLPLADTRFRMK